MFDTLLDDFESVDAQSTEAMTGGFRKLPADENEESGAVDLAGQADGDVQLDSPDELLSIDESESWSDDPVRMYLTQMGEIPLLTRQQEIELAKRIEETRRRFRTKLLENRFRVGRSLQDARSVHRGELPFDRTVQVSVTDHLEKEQILGRLPHNLATLKLLLRRNRHDWNVSTIKTATRNVVGRSVAFTRSSATSRRSVDRRTGSSDPTNRDSDLELLEKF